MIKINFDRIIYRDYWQVILGLTRNEFFEWIAHSKEYRGEMRKRGITDITIIE